MNSKKEKRRRNDDTDQEQIEESLTEEIIPLMSLYTVLDILDLSSMTDLREDQYMFKSIIIHDTSISTKNLNDPLVIQDIPTNDPDYMIDKAFISNYELHIERDQLNRISALPIIYSKYAECIFYRTKYLEYNTDKFMRTTVMVASLEFSNKNFAVRNEKLSYDNDICLVGQLRFIKLGKSNILIHQKNDKATIVIGKLHDPFPLPFTLKDNQFDRTLVTEAIGKFPILYPMTVTGLMGASNSGKTTAMKNSCIEISARLGALYSSNDKVKEPNAALYNSKILHMFVNVDEPFDEEEEPLSLLEEAKILHSKLVSEFQYQGTDYIQFNDKGISENNHYVHLLVRNWSELFIRMVLDLLVAQKIYDYIIIYIDSATILSMLKIEDANVGSSSKGATFSARRHLMRLARIPAMHSSEKTKILGLAAFNTPNDAEDWFSLISSALHVTLEYIEYQINKIGMRLSKNKVTQNIKDLKSLKTKVRSGLDNSIDTNIETVKKQIITIKGDQI